MLASALLCCFAAVAAFAGQQGGGPGAAPATPAAPAAPAQQGRAPQAPPLLMTLPGFADGSTVPMKYTCSAQPQAVSPEIRWSQAPTGTQSFVMLLHDPEPHPQRGINDVTHWMIWNIPGTATGLPESVPAGATLPDGSHQVVGIRGSTSYFGPCAPPGPNHHYTWELLALDTKLDLPETATRDDVMKAANGHVLGAAVWIGLFHR